ncbi:MAG: aminopeptidase, partial [Flavobacteriaceae bacterium]|nr:aminopeptidase [Flavobacteriaceae bacterium]
MNISKYILVLFFLSFFFESHSQTNEINITAELLTETNQIKISQEIIYYNNSNVNLDTIYLQNWANAYKNRHTLLSKRLIENYDKSLYFAKIDKRGYSEIQNIKCNNQSVKWKELEKAIDIVKINLPQTLKPNDSVIISTKYTVKIPIDKYTRYGFNFNNYNLRYWYLAPAVYNDKWQLMSNLDMDDFYMNPSNYKINFKIPLGYTLHSDLQSKVEILNNFVLYQLKGSNRVDIELNIQLINNFSIYKTDSLEIISNLKSNKLIENIKTDVLNRQLDFIENYLGKYPHDKLLVNDITYLKNPVYGLNQL